MYKKRINLTIWNKDKSYFFIHVQNSLLYQKKKIAYFNKDDNYNKDCQSYMFVQSKVL